LSLAHFFYVLFPFGGIFSVPRLSLINFTTLFLPFLCVSLAHTRTVVSELWGTQCVRLKVTTKTDNCGENADCSGKGVCYSNPSMEEYECQCCSGFAGPHCEEIDACNPSPCTNNGICVDLSQGHEGNSYQCLCPYGKVISETRV